jgi:hypothetical protein
MSHAVNEDMLMKRNLLLLTAIAIAATSFIAQAGSHLLRLPPRAVRYALQAPFPPPAPAIWMICRRNWRKKPIKRGDRLANQLRQQRE